MHILARLVTRFPLPVLALWLAAALLAFPFALKAPQRMTGQLGELEGSESTAVTHIIEREFGGELNTVLLAAHTGQNTEALVKDYVRGLAEVDGVQRVQEAQLPGQAAGEGGLQLITAQIPLYNGASEALSNVREYTQDFEDKTGLKVGVTGGQAIADDFTGYAEKDTKRSEMLALPLIAAVLIVVFGALTAAGLPLLVGLLSIALSMAVLYGVAGHVTVATFAQSMVTMLGLGAGIDYALLMVSRFREELASGKKARAAAETAASTAGRAVLWSGSTVAVAMAGLLVPPIDLIQSIGIGGVATIIFTVLAATTALPAALSLLGDRVNRPRLPGVRPGRLAEYSPGWAAWALKVMRRPWPWVTAGTALLLFMASPLLGVKTGYTGVWALGPGIPSRDALADIRDMGAGGLLSQFEVLLKTPSPYDPARDADALYNVTQQLEQIGGVQAVISPFLAPEQLQAAGVQAGSAASLGLAAELNAHTFSPSGNYLRLTVLPTHDLKATEIDALAEKIRAAAQSGPFTVQLGGAPIGEREFSHAVSGALPQIMVAVFTATFLLLLTAFRSLVVPIKSIVLNGLTVAAATGITVWVTSGGGSAIGAQLGFVPVDGLLDVMLPLMLFTVMFGLSMDYEIFLMSRIYEGVQAGKDNRPAVAEALGHTARIITSAALIMFVVFAAFIPGRVMLTKSIGLGLAVAVALDATLVRLVLVPAVMELAGRWNWWLPKWLERLLPKVNIKH